MGKRSDSMIKHKTAPPNATREMSGNVGPVTGITGANGNTGLPSGPRLLLVGPYAALGPRYKLNLSEKTNVS